MSRFVDPKVLMAIRDLQLAAKTMIDGFMSGINKSNLKGSGIEFSQYRSYQAGDDLRWLDWKMYGRSDRYYIRQSEIETSISVKFILDASGSMNHEDSNGIKKIDYARYLIACLAALAHLQNDATGLHVLSKGDFFSLAARRDHQFMARFYYELEKIKAGGSFTRPAHYKHLLETEDKKTLVVFVTDLYQPSNEILQFLDLIASLKHEIIVFHLMGKNEMELDYGNHSTLQDLETGRILNINLSAAKKTYTDTLETYLSGLRMKLLNKHIFYRLITTDQPLDKALTDFLNQRNKLTA
ncbi:MAG: hypothetical protein JWN76_3179 [Chitinophagaceae bacterium]|nr:hypothetical protein [Chitinophagaceae bacterium]